MKQREQVVQALLAAATVLAKKTTAPVEHTAETANKYRQDRGRCPRGWRYSYTKQACQQRGPKDPNAPSRTKTNAAVPKKAPQIEGASKSVNKLLTDLHAGSTSLPAITEDIPVRRTAEDLAAFTKVADEDTMKWWNKLSEDEGEAIAEYTGNSYDLVNNYLRGRAAKMEFEKARPQFATPDDPKLVKMAQDVKSALSKASLPEPAVVFRGTVNPDIVKRFKEGTLVNGSVKTDQFYSTSVNPKVGDDFLKAEEEGGAAKPDRILWNIKVPKGAKASYVDPISDHQGEHEVLMNEGSELQITGAVMKDGVLHLEAEYKAL